MCGIFGVIDFGDSRDKVPIFRDLLLQSCRRGTDASGVGVFFERKTVLFKRTGSGKKMVALPEFKEVLWQKAKKARILIGQTRLATDGSPKNTLNNQPIKVGKTYLVHNGIIINARELAKEYSLTQDESDTRILARILDKESKTLGSMREAVIKLSSKIAGTMNLIVVTRGKTGLRVNVVSNNGSLYIGKKNREIFFASEKIFLERVASKNNLNLEIEQLGSRDGMEIFMDESTVRYKIEEPRISVERTRLVEVNKKLKLHDLDKDIRTIKRCVKCLLPVTTPNISFDKHGLCNYCLEHKKIKYGTKGNLETLVSKYRNKDKKIDCIIAFSGGRDSAYGLHYLVKELGMHPVAVTFDWGMISNIGRRNQAKLLGKLGVEQIIVSADLIKVRQDIKKNLLAWLRKPDLGMVPLLMQADKVTEYYVDKIRKELGVDLVFFCRGNELEREEFKAGYCGVKNADPGGVIHNYSVADKLRLLGYYLKQFLLNPYYLNSSLLSSMLGYFVTYVVPHNYIYLWHYIEWEEKKILKVLFEEYAWEDDGETGITWRIDDGSPAFYNYLYGQIQGFTENDSFRSNQIREGLLTREAAFEIVKKENRPRYSALQWYFDTIGVDGDMVLSTIDKVEKRYKSDKIKK